MIYFCCSKIDYVSINKPRFIFTDFHYPGFPGLYNPWMEGTTYLTTNWSHYAALFKGSNHHVTVESCPYAYCLRGHCSCPYGYCVCYQCVYYRTVYTHYHNKQDLQDLQGTVTKFSFKTNMGKKDLKRKRDSMCFYVYFWYVCYVCTLDEKKVSKRDRVHESDSRYRFRRVHDACR